eukprot:3051466-Karenia_brevis.AAC.1
MPAHKSLDDIRVVRRSDGRRITVVDWRANQLADALAKMAAPANAVAAAIDALFATACEAAQFELAMLGVVTYAANNQRAEVRMADGSSK